MKKKTQLSRIRAHLLKGRPITQLTAMVLYGCMRLSAYIFVLRHEENIPIVTEYPEAAQGKPYARYRVDPEWLERRAASRERGNE